ncbi:MAG TPA: hypothetical protein VK995_03465 [Oceanipulchritudo sp.]|nr:hypothetical protein [Oceanipulchritudo sp.]
MNPVSFLDYSSVWLIYLSTLVILLIGNEAGYRIGKWRLLQLAEGEKAPTTAIMGSILGLLAFMLAFSFGMSSSRFDSRRQLVLDEASAILRCDQRAQMLPESAREKCHQLLAEYVSLRTDQLLMKDFDVLRKAFERSEEIQNELWAEAIALSSEPNALLNSFILSLTELSDLQLKRVRAALWNRIPVTIIATLYTVAFLALMAMGYNAALAGSRAIIPSFILIMAFAVIIVLIVDLERPRQQLFKVSQEPMIHVGNRIGLEFGP